MKPSKLKQPNSSTKSTLTAEKIDNLETKSTVTTGTTNSIIARTDTNKSSTERADRIEMIPGMKRGMINQSRNQSQRKDTKEVTSQNKTSQDYDHHYKINSP